LQRKTNRQINYLTDPAEQYRLSLHKGMKDRAGNHDLNPYLNLYIFFHLFYKRLSLATLVVLGNNSSVGQSS
jgi:hypothetical protein